MTVTKVVAAVGGRELVLEVRHQGAESIVAIAGKEPSARVSGSGPVRSVTTDARSREATVVKAGPGAESLEGERAYDVTIDGRLYAVRLVDPLRRADSAAKREAGGPIAIRTIMPGKVVALLVTAGETVREGQGLVVVEAMKMENEMTAPRAGTVATINARAGEAVESGAVLLTLA